MLYRQTTSDELFNVFVRLVEISELSNFRLVGGTALGLLRGHRECVDIDMFSDGPYGKIPFNHILKVLQEQFRYVEETNAILGPSTQINNQGLYLFIGNDEETSIKTDIFLGCSIFISADSRTGQSIGQY